MQQSVKYSLGGRRQKCSSPNSITYCLTLGKMFNFFEATSSSVLCGGCCSVTQARLTLCDPMDCSTPGFPVHHQLLELTHTYVHQVGDAIQPSHPLSSPSPPTFNLPQHQGLFQWVSSLHQVAKVLEFQPQHQSSQWIFRIDFLQGGLVGSPCSPRDSQESSQHLSSKVLILWHSLSL